MNAFQVTMIVNSTALILITLLLLIIRTMPSRRGLGWWIAAASLQSLAYFLSMLFHSEGETASGQVVFFVLQTTVNHLLVIGSLLFISNKAKLNYALWFTAPALMLVTSSTLLIYGHSFFSNLLFSVENSAIFAIVAWSIFRSGSKRKSNQVLGVFCALISIHWLDYPFLAHNPLFETVGFAIGLALAIGIFMSLTVMALLQFRESTKRSEEMAIYTANHDPLTGLYNRNSLVDVYSRYVREAEEKNKAFITFYLDLDGFKAVNDDYGHKAGDLLLVTVAKRLDKWLATKGDAIRVGGDEIVVFSRLRGSYSIETAYKTARSLLDMIELPIVDGEMAHHISSSIGGCAYLPGVHVPTLDEMISCSDEQMYKAKQAGGHCIFIHNCMEEQRDTKQLHLEQLAGLKRLKKKRVMTVV